VRARRRLIAWTLAIGLAGCGSSGSSSTTTTQTATSPAAGRTELTVKVNRHVRHIKCPGSKLCGRLQKLTPKAFAPVPPTQACTQIYGGNSRAHVEGTLRGRRVKADFKLNNGCEIGRWQRFAWLLGKPR
jgi:hypothetical protein